MVDCVSVCLRDHHNQHCDTSAAVTVTVTVNFTLNMKSSEGWSDFYQCSDIRIADGEITPGPLSAGVGTLTVIVTVTVTVGLWPWPWPWPYLHTISSVPQTVLECCMYILSVWVCSVTTCVLFLFLFTYAFCPLYTMWLPCILCPCNCTAFSLFVYSSFRWPSPVPLIKLLIIWTQMWPSIWLKLKGSERYCDVMIFISSHSLLHEIFFSQTYDSL